MVADNGPLYAYVDIPLKNQPFPATIVIYNINNVYTIDQFDILFYKKNVFLSKRGHFISDRVPRLLEKHSWWSWLRECQDCAKRSRQGVITLFGRGVTTWFHMCNTMVLMFHYYVEICKNEEKPLSKCVHTFDWYCIYYTNWLVLLMFTQEIMLRHSLHPESNSRKITEQTGLTTAHIVRRFSQFYQS